MLLFRERVLGFWFLYLIPVHKSTDRSEQFREVVEVEGVSSYPRQRFLGKEFALLDRYKLQDALVETLEQTKYRHRAPALLNCHRMFRGRVCRAGHRWAKPERSCSLRICPHCVRRRSAEVAAALEPILLSKPVDSLRYMVLSERNCEDLSEGRASVWASFGRLRRTVGWKDKVKGCIVAFEATIRPDGSWHPHLNVLIEGEYYPQKEALEAWKIATRGRGEVVWVSKVTPDTVRELIKYITKISDLVGDPVAMESFLDAVYNQRLFRTYGTFYGLNLEKDAHGVKEKCPDCGIEEFVTGSLIHPQQIAMDFRGILRDKRRQRDVDRDLEVAVSFDPGPPQEAPIVTGKVFARMRRTWEKQGLGFDERRAEWLGGVKAIRKVQIADIPGWDYGAHLRRWQELGQEG